MLQIDNQLLTEIKQVAAQTSQPLTAIIEDALRQMLARRQQMAERPPVQLMTVSGNGVQPGINLDDSTRLLDLMENFVHYIRTS